MTTEDPWSGIAPPVRSARISALRVGHPFAMLVIGRQAFGGQREQQRLAGIEIEQGSGGSRGHRKTNRMGTGGGVPDERKLARSVDASGQRQWQRQRQRYQAAEPALADASRWPSQTPMSAISSRQTE